MFPVFKDISMAIETTQQLSRIMVKGTAEEALKARIYLELIQDSMRLTIPTKEKGIIL